MKKILQITIFALTLSVCAAAQTAETRSIDAYCKTIDSVTKRSAKLVFADTSDYNDDAKAKWQKFASEKALDKFRKTTETYSIAYAWKKNGKIAATNFTLFSPSGDWSEYIFSCYREDGTLAKTSIDYRTFNGDLIMLQDRYFSSSGRLLRKTTKYQDLQTHKPKKPEGFIDGNSSELDKDIYKTVKKLPFAAVAGIK